jgi:hemoglobin
MDLLVPPAENYGYQDTSYKAAGGFEGIERLVNCFYDIMEQLPQAETIKAMHPEDLLISRDKLTRFLCGWLGGPRYYGEKYGPINIPQVHRHLDIGEQERDAWLLCMDKAIAQQPYKLSFKTYLLAQLSIPADRVRVMSQSKKNA